MAGKVKGADLRNVKVTTLRPHANSHGRKYQKAQGDTYVHPRPEADINAGLVEVFEEKAEKKTPAGK